MDALNTVCSTQLMQWNGGGDIVKGQTSGFSGHSMQCTVDAVEQWYMVVGTLSLIQKVQTSGHRDTVRSGCRRIVVYGGGDIVFGAKRSQQWMQYTVEAVYSECSGIVVYGGGDSVFGAKRSNQWMH